MNIEKTFEQYMEENVPTWQTSLSPEVIESLRQKYNNVIENLKVIDNIYNMAFNHNQTGIDFSTAMEKANQSLGISQVILQGNINAIREVMGLNEKEQQSENIKSNQL